MWLLITGTDTCMDKGRTYKISGCRCDFICLSAVSFLLPLPTHSISLQHANYQKGLSLPAVEAENKTLASAATAVVGVAAAAAACVKAKKKRDTAGRQALTQACTGSKSEGNKRLRPVHVHTYACTCT